MKKVVSVLLIVTFFSVNAQTPVLLAGTGVTGYNGNGLPALSTQLSNPTGVAFDKKGVLYYSDEGNSIVRKIDASGNVITVAGNLIDGYNGDGIAATSAELSIPTAIAIDSAGNLYIADQGNARIRKVDTFGIITTVAGGGSSGLGDGGPATAAELNGPSGIAFDTAGNMYTTDQSAPRVRKVDTKGIITTVAGNGTFGYSGDNGAATNAELSGPYGINFDNAGNMYITDVRNGTLRKVDNSGIITTVAGTGTSGYNGDGIAATTAELSSPEGVVVDDSGNIYIADGSNNRIRKVNPGGIISTLVSDTGQIIIPTLGFETAIYRGACGNLYFIDGNNPHIWELPQTQVLSITPLSPIVCSGQGVTLTATGATTYTWSPSTGLSATSGDSVLANPTSNVTYTVTATFGDCSLAGTDVITIIPAPNKPTLTLSANGDTLTSSAKNGNEWFVNDTVIKADTSSILIITGEPPGIYKVVVTDIANGCSTTSDSVVTTGINQLTINSSQLSIYPNPSNGVVTISSLKIIDGIKITNVLGQSVYQSKPKQNKFNLELKGEGMYFITIASGDKTVTQKIIVAK